MGQFTDALICLGLMCLALSANASASIVRGNARFQVLSPTLVRMEYSPTAHFIDEPSVAASDRSDMSDSSDQSDIREKDGWLTINTGKMTLSYKLNSGPFTAENLKIKWDDRAWKPGDKDDKNLGGIPASLDNRSTVAVTDPGPLSRNGWFFLDDSHTALFDKDWVKPRPEKDAQDWYFFVYRQDYPHLLSELARLLGPIPMVPRYVFGSWFGSRAGYSDVEWKMIVDQFREEGLPLDLLVLDSDSTTKITWSGYDWDPDQMPDPKGFFQWMKRQGVRVTVNEHYGALTPVNDSHFEEIRQAMGLPADTKEIPHDLANQKYAGLFMDLLHKPALDMGMAFWWQDGAAPANMEGLDPYLWTRHIEYEGSQRITGRRAYAFCRLGPAWGSHRYGGYFTGDLHGVWESLPVLIPATVRSGNMLVPYVNNLCGGVFVVDLPTELYQRWVQFGAFSPIIWFHGLWGQRLPWEYGEEGIETYRKFVGLRYELIPYTYTYSRIAHDTGLPLVRGMYLEYPNEEAAYTHDQQYMFGKEFLVTPITSPGKTATKEVYLPAGEDWFDYFTGDIYQGGRTINYECPIDRMPVFVKAGSIIPMAPPMDYSDQKLLNPLTLDVYAGKPAEFRLYEDDGISLDYRKNACAWTAFSFKNGTLTIGLSKGEFKGKLGKRSYIIRLHGLLTPSTIQTGPLSTNEAHTIRIEGADTHADWITMQKALRLRSQVREAKRLMKLKHAELLAGGDVKRMPRVVERTEEVERELTAIINSPRGKSPDFGALRQRVLDALVDHPFATDRAIPDVDPESAGWEKKIADGQFTPAEIEAIKAVIPGADLP
jgi:alpha-glucosidase (family GH31 glycosyl hydrolase)